MIQCDYFLTLPRSHSSDWPTVKASSTCQLPLCLEGAQLEIQGELRGDEEEEEEELIFLLSFTKRRLTVRSPQ